VPAYYFEDSEGGHGVSDALQRPELMALTLMSRLASRTLERSMAKNRSYGRCAETPLIGVKD
jgi:hypothetical protein